MKIAAFLTHSRIGEFAFSEENARRLVEVLPSATVYVCGDEETFVEELEDAEVALVWRFRQEWFDRAKMLRVISTPAAGRDYFAVEPPPGVRIIYGRFHGKIMGETAVAMMLGASRGIVANSYRMTTGGEEWPSGRFTGALRTLSGAHVVVLGFGNIGHHAGRLLKSFGARVTGVRRHPEDDCPEWFSDGDGVVGVEELDSVLPSADHLLCVLPSGKETDHLLDARRLGLLPAHAVVYNIGRGNSIDELALTDALNGGAIAAAFLDVFETEPLPDASPLRKARNVFLYPHISAVAPQYMNLYVDELSERL